MMSLARPVLVVLQAFCNGLVCSPPNPTEKKARYHTEEPNVLQIAPLIFRLHEIITWICAIFEAIFWFSSNWETPIGPVVASSICISSTPDIRLTTMALVGVAAVVVGCLIRLDCFRTLGPLFTFDLTVQPEHHLVTSRLYSLVRHPSYTGSMLLVFGLALTHLSRGSWLTECGPLAIPGSAGVIWAAWWVWTFSVGVSRASAEDKQMKKLFKEEWEKYASTVRYWFLPGLI